MVQILPHTVSEMSQKWFSQVRNICVCLAHRVWPLSPNLLVLLFKITSSYFKPANCSFIHSLTKSSPESAPIEVMDSLLMVRGIRTLLRGAVAASSAIFFFSLANMVILSTSLSPCRMWGYMLCGVHWDLWLHQLTKKLCSNGVPLISFLLHLETEKHRNEWMQSWSWAALEIIHQFNL